MIKLFHLIAELEEGYIDQLLSRKNGSPARFELATLRLTDLQFQSKVGGKLRRDLVG